MAYPLLYEINTRCWLRDLSSRQGRAVSLANIPASEFADWRRLGLTHIWLMGVWSSGPRARARALTDPLLRAIYAKVLPAWQDQDVAGSPYAIGDYQVPAELGGEAGLKSFRERLNAEGMKLVLDFVPNHLGVDHPWVWERPDLFVRATGSKPETFRQSTAGGAIWLAHGKDPYFPAWSDTVQLDYRRASTRKAMTDLLMSVAGCCDGLRCDMAMLLLNDVFAKTWEGFPSTEAPPVEEFWGTAIAAIKRVHPSFLFLAEAYWGLEERLVTLGFDYAYDKALYDKLQGRQPVAVTRHLLDLGPEKLATGAHFLENHDEPRIASLMSFAEERASALVVLGLPGMRLLHEGQLTGARVKVPVQLTRRAQEPVDSEIQSLYDQLLTTLHSREQRSCEILLARPAWPGNPTAQNFVLLQRQSHGLEFDLLVVNLAPHRSQCYAPVRIPDCPSENWHMKDLLGPERYVRFRGDLQAHGLYLDLPAHGAQLFRFEPVGGKSEISKSEMRENSKEQSPVGGG
ncbi:MAG TPA: alpha-amylase family glycosyl hydrolase [Candidatus Limnocylindrales bacterium]|jgi:hypothetical protein|nr:alpha-amylase family glycosyl hydrolase [Candidatus Limnocylindrales bacterium]